LALAGATPALALPLVWDNYTGTGVGNWFDPANWSAGVPTLADEVRFHSNGTANIASGNATANRLTIGAGAGTGGTINLSGGSLTSIYDIKVGSGAGSAGTFNQTGGNISIPWVYGLYVGAGGGTGTYSLSAGSTTLGSPFVSGTGFADVIFGEGSGGTANVNISGGTLSSHGVTQMGRGVGSSGTLTMTGGAFNMGHVFWGGFGSTGGQVTIGQSGGTITTGTDEQFLEANTIAGAFLLGTGNTAATRSGYALSGSATLNVNSHLYVGGTGGNNPNGGNAGFADLTLSGGTINIGGPTNAAGSLYIGSAGTGTANSADGTITVTGGTLNMPKVGAILAIGQRGNSGTSNGTGTLTISGGEVLVPKGSVIVGRVNASQSAIGTLNLAGTGRLVADSLVMTKAGDADANGKTFNFTGGTLELNSATSDFVATNNGGTLRPGGAATQILTTAGRDGSYNQVAGTLALDLASNYAHDGLNTTAGAVGAVSLAGNVNVTAGPGYAPSFGATAPVVVAKSITDTATWTLPSLPAGLTWDRRILADGVNLVEAITAVRSTATPVAPGPWSGGAAGSAVLLGGSGGTATIASGVTAGQVQIDATGDWTVDGAGALTLSSAGTPAGVVAFGGTHTIGTSVSFASAAALATVTSSTHITLSGALSGSSTVEKTGPGALTLSSPSSSFSGTWSISGGTLNIDSDANLGAPTASTAFSGASLNVTGGGWATSRAILLRGAGLTLNANGDSSLSGPISGTGGITKSDVNTLTLGGTNTHSGPTTVNAGILAITSGAALSADSALILAPGTQLLLNGNSATVGSLATTGSSNHGNVVTGGANLTVGADNSSTTFNGQIQGDGNGTFNKVGTGTFVINAGPAQDGFLNIVRPVNVDTVHVQAGTLRLNGLTVAAGGKGPIDLPSNQVIIDADATLALGSTGTGRVMPSLVGAGTLAFVSGTTTVDFANPSFTGAVQVRNNATLSIGDMGAVGPSTVPISVVAAGAGTGNATLILNTSGTFSHPIDLANYTLHLGSNGNAITLDQPITGSGQMYFEDTATTKGSITLAAKSTYQGATNVHPLGSQVILAVDDAIPSAFYCLVNGTLDLNGHDQTVGSVIGNQANAEIKISGGKTFSVGADNIDSNAISTSYASGYLGRITGDGGLTKVGYGVQCLSGNNTYTGPTHVKTGALWFNIAPTQMPKTSDITVDAGALLILGNTSTTVPAVYTNPISGGGRVQKNNNAVVEIASDNTYAGGTMITAGTLVVSKDANLGAAAGPITFHLAGTSTALRFKAAFDTARPVVMANGLGSIETNGFDSTFSGPLSGPGSLTKATAGRLTLAAPANAISGTLAVTGGTLALTGQMTAANVNAAGGQLDLGPVRLVVDYATTSPLDSVRAQLLAGRNGGTWDGTTGILTSAAQAPAEPNQRLAIGYLEASQLLGLTGADTAAWDGRTVDATSLLTKLTWYGDANLDGRVTPDDYTLLDRAVALGGLGGVAKWSDGDFDYTGTVDAGDYQLIDRVFHQSNGLPLDPTFLAAREAQFGSDYVAALVASVPEPTGLTVATIATGLLAGRRRRRS
jgi:autotransporter-associated beta strand protein